MGNLYIVATPIGNLQDITIRAIDTLNLVDLIVSEDTRKTGQLLKSLNEKFNAKIKKQTFISYFEHNEEKKIPEIISYLKQGLNVALVSDAGTPTISDPGFKLVRECINQEIKVISIPGPSSAISALVSSGLATDKFTFLGFLPKKAGHRLTFLDKIKNSSKFLKATYIIFVPPHDFIETLGNLQSEFSDISIVVARELTKIFEEIKRDKISKLIAYYSKQKPKGEMVVLFRVD